MALRLAFWSAGLFFVGLLFLYNETVRSMVIIWARSDTFAHGFLILPIALWLLWDRREEIATFVPRPTWWGIPLLLPIGLLWLLAYLVDVTVIQQLAFVAMIVVGVWTILGYQLGLFLVFPLFFLFFAVPIGEGLIQPMMEYTATSTVWMIQMSGIPVYREGLNFALPTGQWSVVEACSGVRYIIASVTVGTLYAYLTYRSWTRRIIFVIVAAIVPVLANSARAYIIVILGHMSGMTIATGVDHLVYGWVFFGVVIFALFWLGAFFREDLVAPDAADTDRELPAGHTDSRPTWVLPVAALTALLVTAVSPFLASNYFGASTVLVEKAPTLPAAYGDWARVGKVSWRWRPPARLASQQLAHYATYGQAVGLYVQYADGFFEGVEVIGSSSLFAMEESGYQILSQGGYVADLPGGQALVDEAHLRETGNEVLAWSWYVLGDFSGADSYRAKLEELGASLRLRDIRGIYRVVVATPAGGSLEDSRERLQSFLDVHGEMLYRELH